MSGINHCWKFSLKFGWKKRMMLRSPNHGITFFCSFFMFKQIISFLIFVAICFLLTFTQIYIFLLLTSCLFLISSLKTTLICAVNSFSITDFVVIIIVAIIFYFLNAGILILFKLALFYSLPFFFIYFVRFSSNLSY